MTHPTWQELSDYADGVGDTAVVAVHVGSCDVCAAELAAIEQLRGAARALVIDVAPPPFAAVQLRIVAARAARRRQRAVRWALAAGVVVAVGGWWGLRSAPEEPTYFVPDARAAVEARVDEQLAIIDAAIAELEVLLEAQPTNGALRAQLTTAERDRAQLGAMAREVLRGAYLTGGM
jgi:anti-sigma factor RsiW